MRAALLGSLFSNSCGDKSHVLGAVQFGEESYLLATIPPSRLDSLVDIFSRWIMGSLTVSRYKDTTSLAYTRNFS